MAHWYDASFILGDFFYYFLLVQFSVVLPALITSAQVVVEMSVWEVTCFSLQLGDPWCRS